MPTNKEDKLIELLSRLVTLLEDSLIIQFHERGMVQRDIRKILNVDMRRITNLLRHVKGIKKYKEVK
jgi:hypothetical protein